jgi:hypothetical protein
MKTKLFAATASALALGLALWVVPNLVQGQPMFDRITVNLPYSVEVGDRTLPPGDYVIQQLESSDGASRVLLFYSDNGMKFETSAMTIPALDINTARHTEVILKHDGDQYFVNKIWVQGKDYGYELPMPKRLKMRETEQMAQTTVPAQATTMQRETATAETTPPPKEEAAAPPPAPAPTPEPEPQPQAQPTQPAPQPAPNEANREAEPEIGRAHV